MKKHLLSFLLLLLGSAGFSQVPANLRFVRVGETVPSSAAYTKGQLIGQAFQQDALVSHLGYQYASYYNQAGNVCIARRKLPLGEWKEVVLNYATGSNDGHNTISIGICTADGTIHLSYDHHDQTLHYTRSAIGLASDPGNMAWSVDNFGDNTNIMADAVSGVCYPRFISRPDGNLFFECRHGSSGNGDNYLRLYNGVTHTWSNYGRYLQGRTVSKNGYINRFSYDMNGRLHVSWVWRDTPTASTNHDLSYAYSDDNGLTWKDRTGAKVADLDPIAYTVGTAGSCLDLSMTSLIINPIPQNRGLINQESHATDSHGRIHVLNSYMLPSEPDNSNWDASRNKAVLHQQYQQTDGTWKINTVKENGVEAVSNLRAQILIDAFDNAFIVGSNTKIWAATPANGYENWGLISNVDAGRFGSCETQVDHTLLLSDGVLSFLQEESSGSHRMIVIDYLLDNPHTPDGAGLKAEYFSDSQFGTVNGTAINVPVSTGSLPAETQSVRWSGAFETLYGEQYTLYINSDIPVTFYADGKKLLEKTAGGEQQVVLPLVASHRHNIIIEAKASAGNTVSLSWSSANTPKAIIPLTSLYAGKLVQDESLNIKGEILIAQTFIDNTVEGNGSGQYPSKAAITSAIAAAQAVADNPNATEEEITQAIAALKAALDTYKATRLPLLDAGKTYFLYCYNTNFAIGTVGSTLTLQAVANAYPFQFVEVAGKTDTYKMFNPVTGQYLYNSGYNIVFDTGGSEVKVTQPATGYLALHINGANYVAANNDSYAVGLGIYSDKGASASAYWRLEEVSLAYVKSQLQTVINEAQTFVNGTTEGTAPGEYPSKATVQSAIDAAQVVHDNAGATIAGVFTAIANVKAALAAYKDTKQTAVETGKNYMLFCYNTDFAIGTYTTSLENEKTITLQKAGDAYTIQFIPVNGQAGAYTLLNPSTGLSLSLDGSWNIKFAATGSPVKVEQDGDYITLQMNGQKFVAANKSSHAVGMGVYSDKGLDNSARWRLVSDMITALPEVSGNDPIISERYYSLQGVELPKQPANGLVIVKRTHQSGKNTISKVLRNAR